MAELLRSPLHDQHVALQAKLADFGGWQMPIEYSASGGGVVKEHTAVRQSVGLFDVSHLGKASVRGADARTFVNACLTNDLNRIAAGQAQYTMCCDESGGVVDDLIAYVVDDDDIFLVPNAANTAEVVRRLADAAQSGIDVNDRHHDFGVLAVQGPRSSDVLARLDLPAGQDYMAFADAEWDGRPVRVCRTGYTGEHGYEIVVAAEHTADLWDALLDVVREFGGLPAGLGARDTLRTEMGYPLHGQDLSSSITPVQARATWAVGWKKPAFWGRDALLAERERGPARTLRGLQALDRGIPRPHMQVRRAADSGNGGATDSVIGEVTSGTFSPTLRTGIGLALIATDAEVQDGDELALDVRGRTSAVRVMRPPFVESHVR